MTPTLPHLRALLVAKPSLGAEYAAVRAELFRALPALIEVAEAAKDLTGWDWLHLLDDSIPSHSSDVIADVEKIRAALAKLEAP